MEFINQHMVCLFKGAARPEKFTRRAIQHLLHFLVASLFKVFFYLRTNFLNIAVRNAGDPWCRHINQANRGRLPGTGRR